MRTWVPRGKVCLRGTWAATASQNASTSGKVDNNLEKLIELVRNNHELYDTSHPNYMTTKLKDSLWEKISKI